MTSLAKPRVTDRVHSRVRGRPIIASGWIEPATVPGESAFFVTEHIYFEDTKCDATPEFYNSLTTAELETIDADYWWGQDDDLGDEDYEGIDHDSSDEDEWLDDDTQETK